jgi:hypothetical protein
MAIPTSSTFLIDTLRHFFAIPISTSTTFFFVKQTMTGIDLPMPRVEFGKVERTDSFASIASISGLKQFIKKARDSLVLKSNSFAPISIPSTQVSQHSSNPPAAELDYSTPAFRNALQQSAATAAGVPMESVKIIDITPTPSGTELEVIYSVEGDKHLETISDFKARIDEAVAGGWFTSSLQGDGYFCVSATAPTTLIHMAFTLKQVSLLFTSYTFFSLLHSSPFPNCF